MLIYFDVIQFYKSLLHRSVCIFWHHAVLRSLVKVSTYCIYLYTVFLQPLFKNFNLIFDFVFKFFEGSILDLKFAKALYSIFKGNIILSHSDLLFVEKYFFFRNQIFFSFIPSRIRLSILKRIPIFTQIKIWPSFHFLSLWTFFPFSLTFFFPSLLIDW